MKWKFSLNLFSILSLIIQPPAEKKNNNNNNFNVMSCHQSVYEINIQMEILISLFQLRVEWCVHEKAITFAAKRANERKIAVNWNWHINIWGIKMRKSPFAAAVLCIWVCVQSYYREWKVGAIKMCITPLILSQLSNIISGIKESFCFASKSIQYSQVCVCVLVCMNDIFMCCYIKRFSFKSSFKWGEWVKSSYSLNYSFIIQAAAALSLSVGNRSMLILPPFMLCLIVFSFYYASDLSIIYLSSFE